VILFIPGVPPNANHSGSSRWHEIKARAAFRKLAAEIANDARIREAWAPPAFTLITARQISPVKRRRDPLGLAERLKGIVDGLVDANLLVDDDESHLAITLAPSRKGAVAGIELTIEPATPFEP